MSKRVSFTRIPPLLRTISNPYNKEDNKYSSQSTEEYLRNRQMAKTGLLRNSGKGPEFDPKKLAQEIRGHCAKGDEGFCHKAMSYVSSIFKDDSDHYDKLSDNDHMKRGGGKKKKTRKYKYKNGTTKKRRLKRKKTLKK
tara:strand:+ start:258 stop:674 length:417 start_codon:yes stop_codon:yes gene_type:complete